MSDIESDAQEQEGELLDYFIGEDFEIDTDDDVPEMEDEDD